MIGGAVVYRVMRFVLLSSTNPLMGFVPPIAFLVAHLLVGPVVGTGLAIAYARQSIGGDLHATH